MTSPFRPWSLVLLTVLGSLVVSPAWAGEPAAELAAPPAPSAEINERLAELRAALPERLHARLMVVVADAQSRLRASLRAAAQGEGEAISLADACGSALLAADFAGVSKRRSKLPALVELTTYQLTVDLHAALREQVGRQLAVRAVKACRGGVACLDGIVATPSMPGRHVASVRAALGDDVAALENEERAGAAELDVLGVMYSGGLGLLVIVSQEKSDSASRD